MTRSETAEAKKTHPTRSGFGALEPLWRWTRVALAIALLALLAFGPPGGPEPGESVRVDGSTPPEAVAAILAQDRAATLIWQDTVAPTRHLTALLAAGAQAGADVALALPDGAGALRVVAPHRPVAGRRGALQVSVRSDPEVDVPVTITGQAGATDTVVVTTGPEGRGSVSVAVQPTSAGATSWTVRTPDAAATAHAWVRPARPLRVLVWSGTPGWESRYLLRALEAAGMDVATRQELGRALSVATEGTPTPTSLDDLSAYDVLALVGPGADLAEGLARRWVVERGGGLLLVGAGSVAPGLAPWAPRGSVTERPASQLAWVGPTEIVPLPLSEVVIRAVDVPGSGMPVALVGETTDGGSADPADDRPVLARASHVGRGRVFASGFDSWPWAMEAGLVAEHRAFWESVVAWLAGGLTEDMSLEGQIGQPWVRWTGRIEGDAPAGLLLTRPDSVPLPDAPTSESSTSDERLAPEGASAGSNQISFVPVSPGGYGLAPDPPPARSDLTTDLATESLDPSPTLGAVAAPPTERMTWTAAALELGAAGARILPFEDPSRPDDARPASPSRTLPWLLFLTLAALAVTGWAARRIAGRP